jgi:hypothetical protein
MTSLLCRLALVAVSAVLLPGCGADKAETPKEYAPPPKTGPGGALKGGESSGAPVRPK